MLYLGWAIDRFGARRSLALNYASGIVFIALISLFALPYLPLLAVVLLAAAPLGGFLLSRGLPTYVFLSACVFAAIAAVATGFLALPGRQASRIMAMEATS